MADLDSQVDALYQLPLADFTDARTALAKTLKGDAKRHVRALKKPTSVPWAINQVYWSGRPAYEAAMQAGHTLRAAQIATLKGKKADVRTAVEAHRQAVANAVHRALQSASKAGLNPNAEQIARMFEAISLAATPPAAPGRFTEVIAPSGFDALAGVTPAKRVPEPDTSERQGHAEEPQTPSPATKVDRAAEKRRVEQERREQREAEAQVEKATRDLDRARERAQEAREAFEHAQSAVSVAERQLADARDKLDRLSLPLPPVRGSSNRRHER